MALKEIAFSFSTHSVTINCPDSEMKAIFLEGFDLLKTYREILVKIQYDIDEVAKQKKQIRLADAAWYRAQIMTLPGLDSSYQPPENVFLFQGRPRKMDAEATFFMMLVRGHINSVTSKVTRDRIADSKLIDAFFSAKAMTLPAATSIHDYRQAITPETRQYIFEQELNKALAEGLDSMESLTIDSLSVATNSKWPTDSRIIQGLLSQVVTLGLRLSQWGLPGLTKGYYSQWLERLKDLDYKMALTAGKPRSKGKIKKYYRLFLKVVDKVLH